MTTGARERKATYGRAPGKPACSFGKGCYRKNPKHFAEEDHPDGHPLIAGEAAAAAAAARPPPPAVPPPAALPAAAPPAAPTPNKRPRDEDEDAFEASLADYDLDAAVAAAVAAGASPPGTKTHAAATPSPAVAIASAAAVVTAAPSSSSSSGGGTALGGVGVGARYVPGSDRAGWHAQLLAAFLVPFDDDTFELFEVAAREKPHAPSSAWASAGLTLLAPFKVLGGELAAASATPLSERGAYDPPELQPLARLSEPSGAIATVGYWRDEPSATEALLVVSRPNAEKQGPGVEIRVLDETHLLPALAQLCKQASTAASLRSQAYLKVANALGAAAEACGVASVVDAGEVKAGMADKARRKAAIAPTSSKMGIRVPYDRKTEVGYRKLDPSGAPLRKLLDELEKASGAKQASMQKDLDDLIGWANIANDECDFGASLQLGHDLFNHSLAFAPVAARTLYTAYTLLEREPYAQIAKMHHAVRGAK